MNDIEILEDFIEGKIEPDKLENYKGGYKMGFFYTKDLQKAIENLIQRNKELEYKYEKALDDLVKSEKERQEDKEKIKELETINKMQEYRINEMDIPKFLVEEKIEYKENLIFEIENITLFKKLNEVERRKIIELKIEIELLKELLKCGGNNEKHVR